MFLAVYKEGRSAYFVFVFVILFFAFLSLVLFLYLVLFKMEIVRDSTLYGVTYELRLTGADTDHNCIYTNIVVPLLTEGIHELSHGNKRNTWKLIRAVSGRFRLTTTVRVSQQIVRVHTLRFLRETFRHKHCEFSYSLNRCLDARKYCLTKPKKTKKDPVRTGKKKRAGSAPANSSLPSSVPANPPPLEPIVIVIE